jgi:hypothetical protein
MPVRIERTETPEPITPRVERFLIEALGGVNIDDDKAAHTATRPDYLCLRGLLVVELKSLEEDGSERMDNLMEELRQRDDWPQFLGSAPIQAYLKHTADPEGLRLKVLNRMGRAIINHLKKANRQIEAHKVRSKRKNMVGTLLIVNENHSLYDPPLVASILKHALSRTDDDGKPLYEHVDLALYLTERHVQVVDNRPAHPVLILEGSSVVNAGWKSYLGDLFVHKWAEWNESPLLDRGSNESEFVTIDEIPELAPRHERWRTNYRRNPYLRPLSNEDLRRKFDEAMAILTARFVRGCPVRPKDAVVEKAFESFTHVTVEMGDRAIPAEQFPMEFSRLAQAALRLKSPTSVVAWLADQGKAEA